MIDFILKVRVAIFSGASLILSIAALLLSACGGGGDSSTTTTIVTPGWELAPGICSFDDDSAQDRATRQGAVCTVILINNTVNGRPIKSWPLHMNDGADPCLLINTPELNCQE